MDDSVSAILLLHKVVNESGDQLSMRRAVVEGRILIS